MPIRNHIARKDTTWCGDPAPIKYSSLDEVFEYMDKPVFQYQENEPCAKCLTILANICHDELGFMPLSED
jgi:hypothetical protein